MDRLKIWLISGLVVLLALGALYYFRGPISEITSPEKQETVETEERAKPKGFAKPVEPSGQEKAEEDAKAISEALSTGDINDCENITWDEDLKKQCEDNLNYASIVKSGDESECKKLHDETLRIKCLDKVYMSVAVDRKDASYCEKIADASLKQMCFDQVSMLLAHSADSADDCSSISSEILRKQCEDNYYLKSSARELDLDGCSNISDPLLAQQCQQTVTKNIEVIEQSKVAAENAHIVKSPQEILVMCNELSENKATLCKDAVYPQLAFDEKDLSYCDKISDSVRAQECKTDLTEQINTYYLRQAIASNDKSICDQISDNDLKNICKNS